MKHYISICGSKGDKEAQKIDLFEWSVLVTQPQYAAKEKDDSMLVFNGYSDLYDKYPRPEVNLTSASSVFIDCDNPNADPDIMEKWRNLMKDYDWMIYETASSTKERPKFRAIVPLENEIPWNKYTKKAIFQLFDEFADTHASWFFAPTLDKLDTIEENTTGRWMPVDGIMTRANKIRDDEQIAESIRTLLQMKRELNGGYEKREDSWRFLPSVKKCLEGLHQGERDSSLNAACYAMDKNGYRDHIREFLDEVLCDRSIKAKFYHKYR